MGLMVKHRWDAKEKRSLFLCEKSIVLVTAVFENPDSQFLYSRTFIPICSAVPQHKNYLLGDIASGNNETINLLASIKVPGNTQEL